MDELERDRRSKRIATRFYGSIILFIIALLFIIGIGLIINNHQNNQRIYDNCVIGNDFRENNRKLWDYIINLTPDRQLDAEQTKRVNDFKLFLNKTFELRDCNNL